MEKHGNYLVIKDVNKLPYPREVILESICRQFPKYKKSPMGDHMEVAIMHLAAYQEGVGVEDLTLTDPAVNTNKLRQTLKDSEKFSQKEQFEFTLEVAQKITSYRYSDNKKKYDYFDKLREEDEKLFLEKLGAY